MKFVSFCCRWVQTLHLKIIALGGCGVGDRILMRTWLKFYSPPPLIKRKYGYFVLMHTFSLVPCETKMYGTYFRNTTKSVSETERFRRENDRGGYKRNKTGQPLRVFFLSHLNRLCGFVKIFYWESRLEHTSKIIVGTYIRFK